MQVWNDVGIVRQYNSEEENSIDIEFHDTSVHHAMHITNNHNYTMASLSTEAVLLASESDVDSSRYVSTPDSIFLIYSPHHRFR